MVILLSLATTINVYGGSKESPLYRNIDGTKCFYFVDSLEFGEAPIIYLTETTSNIWVIAQDNNKRFMKEYDNSGDEFFMNQEYAYLYLPELIDSDLPTLMDVKTMTEFDKEMYKHTQNDPSKVKYEENSIPSIKNTIKFTVNPDYWLLFLVRGDVYNFMACTMVMDSPTRYLTFKNPYAYYKVVYPCWKYKQ